MFTKALAKNQCFLFSSLRNAAGAVPVDGCAGAQADRLLLDVPCSGSGVLRRNPDTKWKLNEKEMERLHATQYEILSTYSSMTKKGGQMVYATCSVFPSENEQQVKRFLKEHGQEWRLVREIHLRPDKEGFDGFYGALLRRG